MHPSIDGLSVKLGNPPLRFPKCTLGLIQISWLSPCMYPTQDLEKSESVMNCCEDHWQVEKCSLSRRTDPPFPPPPAAANRVTPSPPPDPHPILQSPLSPHCWRSFVTRSATHSPLNLPSSNPTRNLSRNLSSWSNWD